MRAGGGARTVDSKGRTWWQLWQVDPELSMTHPGLSEVLKGGKVWVRLLRASVPSLWPASTFAPDLFAPPAPSPRPTTLPSFLLPSFSLHHVRCSIRRPKGHPSPRQDLRRGCPRHQQQAQALVRCPSPGAFRPLPSEPRLALSRTIHRSLHSSSAQLTDHLSLSPPRRPSSPAPRLSRSTFPERAE